MFKPLFHQNPRRFVEGLKWPRCPGLGMQEGIRLPQGFAGFDRVGWGPIYRLRAQECKGQDEQSTESGTDGNRNN